MKIHIVRTAKLVAGIVVALFLFIEEYNVETLFRLSDAKLSLIYNNIMYKFKILITVKKLSNVILTLIRYYIQHI